MLRWIEKNCQVIIWHSKYHNWIMFIFAFIIVDLPLLVKNEWNKTSQKWKTCLV